MTIDDGLRKIIRDHLPQVHWSSIETGFSEAGVPDLNGCWWGDFWIECKATSGWAVEMRPAQIGWLLRHDRCGGRTFIAVRRRCAAGKRREAADELWLYRGAEAPHVAKAGLQHSLGVLARFPGGPSRWDWGKVLEILGT